MLRPFPLLIRSTLSSFKSTPFRLLSSAAGIIYGGQGRLGHGTVSAVLEIVGPFHLLFPAYEARLYVRLLRCCARGGLNAGAAAVHSHFLKRGFAADALVCNVLLDTYAKGGALAACRHLFDEMSHRDVVSWCTVIAAHGNLGLCVEALGLFKELLSSELRPNRFVISTVLNVCARSGVLELGLVVHGLVAKSGLGIDRFVEVGFVDMYATFGNVADAIRLFDEIPVKSSVAWNAMISGYVENGCFVEAAKLCWDMHQVGMAMDAVTLRVVAGVAAVLGMFELCRNIHVYALKVGLGTDCFVVAKLIKLAGKVGEVQYMGKLVASVRRHDMSLYSLAISGYHSNGCRDEALKLAEELLSSGLSLREGNLVTVLDICRIKQEFQQIHAHIVKTGGFSYTNVSNALISAYSELGALTLAESIFKTMQSRDVVSWTAIMAGYVKNLQFEKAIGSFRELRSSGTPLDHYCVATVANACAGLQDMEKGKQIHSLVLKLGLLLIDFISASLVNMYAKCHYIESAAELFFHSSFPQNLVVTNAMLSGYFWNFLPRKALLLFCREYRSGLRPDQFTFSTVLAACADIGAKEAGEQIHCCLVKIGCEYFDIIVGNAIINLYVKCGCIASACRFFHSMKSWNMNSYAMLMLGYIQNRCSDESLRLFTKVHHSGLHANQVTFARILRGCADLCAIDLGRQLHGSIVKKGLISDVYVADALVGMYKKSEGRNESKRKSQETLMADGPEWDSKSKHYSEHKDIDSTLEEIGLFTLEERKDHETVNAQKLYISAASQLYGKPLPMHVAEHELSLDSIVENGRNGKYNEGMLWPNYKNAGHLGNGVGSFKLFNLVQENSIKSKQIVLVVFIDNGHSKMKDAGFDNMKLVRSCNALAPGIPP